jgi:SAM-dependent methyltransferase
MTQNKDHWYDGWFYDKVIAPNQDKLFSQIMDIIEPGSSVIDIGCGTGRLAFIIAGKCKSVTGIDLSARNITMAKKISVQKSDPRISFIHGTLTESLKTGDSYFDYAVLTYVIHEVEEAERINLLSEAAGISKKIIIGDYVVPGQVGLPGWLSKKIEYMAGEDHYRNYMSYMRNGGIYYLARAAGLKIVSERNSQQSTNHIVILEK